MAGFGVVPQCSFSMHCSHYQLQEKSYKYALSTVSRQEEKTVERNAFEFWHEEFKLVFIMKVKMGS